MQAGTKSPKRLREGTGTAAYSLRTSGSPRLQTHAQEPRGVPENLRGRTRDDKVSKMLVCSFNTGGTFNCTADTQAQNNSAGTLWQTSPERTESSSAGCRASTCLQVVNAVPVKFPVFPPVLFVCETFPPLAVTLQLQVLQQKMLSRL